MLHDSLQRFPSTITSLEVMVSRFSEGVKEASGWRRLRPCPRVPKHTPHSAPADNQPITPEGHHAAAVQGCLLECMSATMGDWVAGSQSSAHCRVAVCQFEPKMMDKTANLAKIEDMARRAALAGAELIVFPECCLSGYPVTPELSRQVMALAEEVHGPRRGPSVLRLERLAAEVGADLVVGLPERDGDTVANTAVVVSASDGVVGAHRKAHLWVADREFFTAGEGFATFSGPFGLYGVLICYDVEFPEAARLLALQGARLIVVSTANMAPWQEYQRVFSRARAMENQLFMAAANYIGTVESVEFFGGSIIVDPFGRVLAAAGSAEAILVADLDADLIAEASAATDYLNQRRPALYGPLSEVNLGAGTCSNSR